MKNHETDIKRAEGLPMGGSKKPMKSTGGHQATAEGKVGDANVSTPNMGSRPMSMHPKNSEVGYPHRPTPKSEKVREVAHDSASLKKARMFNERSQNGGADPSAYPCE